MAIQANGDKIRKMDVVHIFIRMDNGIKEVGLKIRNKEKEVTDIEIQMFMMEYGKMIEDMDKVQ